MYDSVQMVLAGLIGACLCFLIVCLSVYLRARPISDLITNPRNETERTWLREVRDMMLNREETDDETKVPDDLG